jgi:hypothetical protein
LKVEKRFKRIMTAGATGRISIAIFAKKTNQFQSIELLVK